MHSTHNPVASSDNRQFPQTEHEAPLALPQPVFVRSFTTLSQYATCRRRPGSPDQIEAVRSGDLPSLHQSADEVVV